MQYRIFIIIIFCAIGQFLTAQNYAYWVAFTDKNSSPYSLENPQDFLSERALQRRIKQRISLDESDLPVNPSYVASLSMQGATIVGTSRWLNGATIFVTDTSIIASIRALSFVSMVQRTKSPSTSNQVMRQKLEQKFVKVVADSAFRQKNIHHLPALHALGFCGEGMQVAIIDAGFLNVDRLPAFDSLRIQNRLLGTRDFVDPQSNIYQQHLHGLAVLSTMAANLPNKMVGSAPRASYWLLRTEDVATESLLETDNWVRAIEFADSVGVDVVNSSLGYTLFDDSSTSFSYDDLDGRTTRISLAATMAARKGILVVNSAGNEGASTWHYINAPADADSILTVGGVGLDCQHISFSSYGPTADNRIKPTLCSVAYDAYVMDGAGGIYGSSGTSFASPNLAGVATCLWQALPYLTNIELIELMKNNASQRDTPDNTLGYGIPDVWQAYCMATKLNQEQLIQPKFFPNPFSEKLTYAYKDTIQITIFDAYGRIIYAKNSKIYNIDTSAWSKGFYIAVVRTDGDILVEKLVKK